MRASPLFYIAAAWNLIGAIAICLTPALFYKMNYGYDGDIGPLWLQLHRVFWVFIALFGFGYAMVARDPVHNRGVITLGILGKTLVGLVWVAQALTGFATPMIAGAALGDLIFAALFFRYLQKNPIT